MKRLTGVDVPANSWDESRLEPHHHFNICVLDEAGKVIQRGRDLQKLRQRFSQQVSESLQSVTHHAEERTGITQWDFGELGKTVDVHQAGMKLKAFPAIEDAGNSVSLVLSDTPEKAQQISSGGVLRLLMLASAQQVKYLQKNLPKLDKTLLYFSKLGDRKTLVDDLLKAAFYKTFLEGKQQPSNETEFKACIEKNKADLVTNATDMAERLNRMGETFHLISKKLNGQVPLPWMPVYAEIKTQLERFVLQKLPGARRLATSSALSALPESNRTAYGQATGAAEQGKSLVYGAGAVLAEVRNPAADAGESGA